MGALANYIERAGVATTSISLIREQSEAVCPPRALWVPFDLGRPFGVAGDAAFQTAVLRRAFGLLESAIEPTIEDYEIEAHGEAGPGVWACPVSFPTPADTSLTGRLQSEITRLAPWMRETRRARGRTLFGASGADPENYEALAAVFAQLAEAGIDRLPASEIEWAHPMPLLLRHMADDLRTLYHEALAAQPGAGAPNHAALNEWIFNGTALGEALIAVADHLTASGEPYKALVRGFLIPEGFYQGGSAFPTTAHFGNQEDDD
ncbi:MAG: hypothetical protein AAF513_19955 [Pseudomonadota bacterium]